MTHPVLLNNVEHKDMRIITRRSAEFGDDVHLVPAFPTEFADVQREYPILFRKQPGNGEYQSVALLGFSQGENLFLEDGGWGASYVPAMVARGPFLIGFQEQESEGEVRREPVIHVDVEDPRVNETEGEPLFLEHGGNSPYLQRVAEILRGIQEGIVIGRAMFTAFERHALIEPVNLEISVLDDVQYVLTGYYTISRERLAALAGRELAELNGAGFLEGAFLVLASLGNVPRLIERKRRQIAAA